MANRDQYEKIKHILQNTDLKENVPISFLDGHFIMRNNQNAELEESDQPFDADFWLYFYADNKTPVLQQDLIQVDPTLSSNMDSLSKPLIAV
jgi:hypothetical protein